MSLNTTCGAIAVPVSRTTSSRAGTASARKSPTLLERAFAALAAQREKLSTAIRHRRELEQLARFNDRELRDLAVTRNDIAFALSEPLWRDPAVALRQARRPLFEVEGAKGCGSKA